MDASFERLTYERYDACRQVFVRESRESFLESQASLPTMIYAHGNSLDHEAALDSCWKVYDRLRDCPGPKLLVLWSWPAEILYRRPLLRPAQLARENIRAKYVFAEYQGYYIAKLTNMMSTAQPLTLCGHSYGGVSAICALHYLGGGLLNGLALESGAPVERSNLRASIISGALDCDHLYPGHRYGQALVSVERFHTTFSTRDATLRRWPTLSLRGQQALGYTGICAARLGENAHKILQQNLTLDVGKSHYLRPHLASAQMVSAICQTAFNVEACPCGQGNEMRGDRIRTLRPQDLIDVPAQTVFPGLAL